MTVEKTTFEKEKRRELKLEAQEFDKKEGTKTTVELRPRDKAQARPGGALPCSSPG
jgi:hypothetical protein